MQPTCIEGHKKVLSKFSNVKVFTVDPYFGVTFLTGQENLPTFSTHIGLGINFLAGGTLFLNSNDTLSYASIQYKMFRIFYKQDRAYPCP